MAIKSKHRYSTMALLVCLALMLSGLVGAYLQSRDVDLICDEEGSVLYRNGTEWQCEPATDLVNLSSTTYLPTSYNITRGVHDDGNLSSIRGIQDGSSINISESAGASPLTMIVNFTNVTDFNTLMYRVYYQGGAGHTINIGLYHCTNAEYENHYGTITDMDDFATTLYTIYDPENHICNGTVSLSFNHTSNGIGIHNFYVDYTALIDGITTTVTTEHDSMTGRDSIENHPWALDTTATRNITGNLTLEQNMYVVENAVIGATSGGAVLEVVGGSGDTEFIINSSDANPDMRFAAEGDEKVIMFYRTSADTLEFHVNDSGVGTDTYNLVLEDGGFAGFNVPNPAMTIDIDHPETHDDIKLGGTSNDNYAGLSLQTDTTTGAWIYATGSAYSGSEDAGSLTLYNAGGSEDIVFKTGGNNIRGVIDGSGKWGINTYVVPHAGIGSAMLAMDGTVTSDDGPHIQITTTQDNYPIFQMLNWQHDDIELNFDAYYSATAGGYRSSDVGSNMRQMKLSDVFRWDYSTGNAQGAAIAWTQGFTMSLTDGAVTVDNSLTTTNGDITASAGDIITTAGDISSGNNLVVAGDTVLGGATLKAEDGSLGSLIDEGYDDADNVALWDFTTTGSSSGYQIGRMRIQDSDSWGSGEDDGSILQLIHTGTVDPACDGCTVLDLVEDDHDEFVLTARDSAKATPYFTVSPDPMVHIGGEQADTGLEISTDYVSSIGSFHIDSPTHAYMSLDASSSSYDSGIWFQEAAANQALIGYDASENHLRIYDYAWSGPVATFDSTNGVTIYGDDEANEKANLEISSAGALIISTTIGSDSGAFIDMRPEDNNYGLLIRESDGTGTTPYANMYVTDASDDYLSIGVNTVKDDDALVLTGANRVGVGTIPDVPFHVSSATQPVTKSEITTTLTTGNRAALYLSQATTADMTTGFGAGLYFVATDSGVSDVWGGGISSQREASGDDDMSLQFYAVNNWALTQVMEVDYTGRLGIQTATPGDALDVNGQIRVSSLAAASATAVCRDGSNQLSTCSSSAELKNIYEDYNSSINKIMGLNPKYYSWKDSYNFTRDMPAYTEEIVVTYRNRTYFNETSGRNVTIQQPMREKVRVMKEGTTSLEDLDNETRDGLTDDFLEGKRQVGLIAEEVYEIAPECVFKDLNGNIQGYHDKCMIAMLINGMQEQQEEIETLQEELCSTNNSYTWCREVMSN